VEDGPRTLDIEPPVPRIEERDRRLVLGGRIGAECGDGRAHGAAYRLGHRAARIGLREPHRLDRHRTVGPQDLVDAHRAHRRRPIPADVTRPDRRVDRLLIVAGEVSLPWAQGLRVLLERPVADPIALAGAAVEDSVATPVARTDRIAPGGADADGP